LDQLQDKIAIERKGFFYFDNKPFIVKGWNPKMDIHTESLKIMLLWVQLYDLDLKYWGLGSLSKIASILGIPLKIDKYIKEKSTLRYARILIEMNVEGPFPEFVEFFNKNDVLVRQTVKYKWLPTKCAHYNMFGHTEDQCRKKNGIHKEWRRVQHDQPTENTEVSLRTYSSPRSPQTDSEDGFITVTRKGALLQAPQSVPGP